MTVGLEVLPSRPLSTVLTDDASFDPVLRGRESSLATTAAATWREKIAHKHAVTTLAKCSVMQK
jgi:hypothetical protein